MNQAQGSWYLNVLASLSVLPMMILMIRYIDRNYVFVIIAVVVLFCMLFYINKTASRTEYAVLLLSIFFYYISIGRLRLRIINVILFGFIIINVLFFANLARAGLSLNLSTLDRQYSLLVPLLSLLTDLNPVDCGIMLLHNRYQFDWLLFKYILLTPIAIVPRALLPFKPDTGIEAIITTKLFGEGFYNNSTQTFTIPVMGYMNAGYVGVIVIAILFSLLTSILYKGMLSDNKYIKIFSIYYLMVLLSLYRTSFETAVVAFMTIALLFVLMHLICYPLKRIRIRL
ncbi:O-antigen polymerase [Geotalea uraniireducens]|nr:O-antigen polymerase [Geotalea uraniireducens]